MKKITIILTLLFLTVFSWHNSAQLTENFEAGLTNIVNIPGNTTSFAIETAIIHGGTQSVKNAYSTDNLNIIEQAIAMDLSATTNPILNFWHIAKTEGLFDKCYVEISTDGGTTYVALPASTYLGLSANYATAGFFHEDSYTNWGTANEIADNSWWKKETFDLSAYKVANVKLRFMLISDGSIERDGWFIDDITVTDPACLSPLLLTVSNENITTVDLGWTDTAGASLWDVEVVTTGSAPTGTPTDVGVTNSFTKTGLTNNTAYDFYVRADCGGGSVSTWNGPLSFNTLCDVFVAPYLENFEDGGAIDNCWSMSGGEDWLFSNAGTGHVGNNGTITGTTNSGNYYAWVDDSGDPANDVALTSPLIDVSGLTTPVLSFYLLSNNEGNPSATLNVEVHNGSAWVNIGVLSGNTPGGWEQKIIDFSGLTITGNIRVRFVIAGSQNFYDDIAVDDVEIKEAPTCFVPNSLSVSNIATTTADVAFTDNANTTNYEYVAQLDGAGVPTGTGTPITTNPVTISGLTSSTTYNLYIRADCGGGDFSDWVRIDFLTACDAFGSFIESFDTYNDGDSPLCWSSLINSTSTDASVEVDNFNSNSPGNNMRMYNSSDTTAQLYLITPQLTDLPLDTHRIRFSISGGTVAATGDNYFILLGTMTDPTDATTFHPVIGIDAPANYVEHVFSFTNSTTDQYVAFKRTAEGIFQTIRIDDVSWEAIPSCIEVTDIAVSGVTTSDVTIAWTENNTTPATAWEYVIQAPGTGVPTAAGTAAGTNPVTDTTLAANTAYEVYVRAACSATNNSYWTGPISFSTPCDTFTAPYNEGFENAGNLNTCWLQDTTDDFDWSINNNSTDSSGTGPSAANSGTYYIYTETSSPVTNNDKAVIYSPNIDISGLTTPRLNFSYHMFGAGMDSDGTLSVDITTDGGATFTNIFSEMGNHGDQWNYSLVDISAYSGVVSFKISGIVSSAGTTYENDFAIDDFKVEETPVTVPMCATNVVAANVDDDCGNFGMIISWDAITGADAYKITIGTTAGGNDIADNVDLGINISSQFDTTVNTTYYYTITPFNLIGDATGCTEETFTTAPNGCYCNSAPSSIDANGVANVQIVATDFVSLGNVAYEDHTATVVDITRSITNNVQVTFETGYTYDTNIWIDLNDDFTFDDATELVYSGESLVSNPATLDASFILDAAAALGQHRMRIGTADTGQATPNACYSGSYGITLDFTINVIESTCTAATATATIVPDCANLQYTIDVDVTSVGDATELSDGTNTWPITATGIITVGPLTGGTSVDLTVIHSDVTCNLPLGTFTYTCPPTNDDCANTITLVGENNVVDAASATQTMGTIASATDSGVAAGTCNGTANDDVWYSFVATEADYNITIFDDFDGVVDLFSGTCGALTAIDCHDFGTNPEISATGLTVGDTYYVRIYNYSSTSTTTPTFGIAIWRTGASTASINDLTSVGFNYYPNPVSNELTMTANENITSVSIFNMLGQEVKTLQPSALEATVDMTNLAAGTYFVKAQVGTSVGTFKVIKK